ncbi:radical SAM protein [Methanothermobacter tenebrarum]|uniref:Radical SAM protein n=1 Tax=Methanothermobacter tenebrarum TaxID=680118 RepID=A0A328PID8_9EURY|nr:radical SAM protein [Methanothermobacter tenebrarum]MBC7100870.1 radical SAM protein [Methanobacteriales archaeon]NPV64011.1 radical SAM protein [Methanobacteriaceae archaeon]RAO79184.1 radical SAM protein [Methanothermobacter tenebrarum]
MGITINNCRRCNICNLVLCPAGNVKKAAEKGECFECGACTLACPYEVIKLEKTKKEKVEVTVDGKKVKVAGLVKDALKAAGIDVGRSPENNKFMPCECGGCWACAVKINDKIALSCITPLSDGMEIETDIEAPLRVMSGFGAHMVGGVGTPYYLKNSIRPIEVVGFTHGCNLRCPQCQNHRIAFTAKAQLLEPKETANILLGLESIYGTGTITFSGGECTLNKKWLLETIKNIKREKGLNIHVDTNGTILKKAYIDQLVKRGMTQIGIDLKALKTKTFQHITGLKDKKIAKEYLKNSWNATEYINNNYQEKVYLGIGIPYNKDLITIKELKKMAEKIRKINPEIQVCVLDYRPEFKRQNIKRPSYNEMIQIKKILNKEGLRTVIVQTTHGHIGP